MINAEHSILLDLILFDPAQQFCNDGDTIVVGTPRERVRGAGGILSLHLSRGVGHL
jgi:hypothetical protein